MSSKKKYGKNSKGVSNNTAKRIERVSPFYKFDGKNILYRKNLEQNWRIVPAQNERSDIIWKAHLIGHFQLQSTYDRIKEIYYWKNMKDHIGLIIKQCETCDRNQKQDVMNHPAIAL